MFLAPRSRLRKKIPGKKLGFGQKNRSRLEKKSGAGAAKKLSVKTPT